MNPCMAMLAMTKNGSSAQNMRRVVSAPKEQEISRDVWIRCEQTLIAAEALHKILIPQMPENLRWAWPHHFSSPAIRRYLLYAYESAS